MNITPVLDRVLSSHRKIYIMISFFANIFIQYTKARSFIRLPDISQVKRNYIDLLDISLLYLNFNIL
jgi:hypothetical protein